MEKTVRYGPYNQHFRGIPFMAYDWSNYNIEPVAKLQTSPGDYPFSVGEYIFTVEGAGNE